MKIESDASYIEVLQTLDAAVSLNFSEWFPAVLKLDSGERATLRNRLRASASAHAAELGKR